MPTQLYRGGAVYSPLMPDATALAVTDGVVSWIGRDDVGTTLHPDAEIVELGGSWVGPGFVDSHVHVTATGLALARDPHTDLSAATSRTDLLDRVAMIARTQPTGVLWLVGWDESEWADQRPPSTAELDAVVGERAVYVARRDEHSALASTALRHAATGLTDVTGYHPSEPLTAEAHHRVRRAADDLLSPDQRTRAQRRALDDAAAHGVVAVHENAGPEISGLTDFAALQGLVHPVLRRYYWGEWVANADSAFHLLGLTAADALGGDLFVDGALGSHTAWLTAPYADGDTTGQSYLDTPQIAAHLRACTEAGVQAGFHAIGDAAAHAIVAALVQVEKELGSAAVAARGHRLEHAEMLSPEAVETCGRLGIIASVQPMFDSLWGGSDRLYAQRLGQQRAATLNNFAALARHGVPVALSSDSPVTPPRPWQAIAAAVHHRTPGNGISARGAFAGATRGGWRAAGITDGTGTLVPGAPAHFAVWEAAELGVQAAQRGDDAAGRRAASIARWSTDPNSRVAPLPVLAAPDDPDFVPPRCLRTVISGTTVYEAP